MKSWLIPADRVQPSRICVNSLVEMADIDLIFFDAGGGHRSAARALQHVLERRVGSRVRLLNLQEALDPIDLLRRASGMRLQDAYNLMLKKGWTRGASYSLSLLHALIRLYHPQQVRLLERWWQRGGPDLVVSLVPHFNRALFESLRRVLPSVPLVTVLTDLADYPPHFWIEPQEQYFICGSRRAVEQAREIGVRAELVYQVSGMLLHPRFYEPFHSDRRAERMNLGLHPDLPTGLVMFGGEGSTVILDIVSRLECLAEQVQLILICGRNAQVEARLRRDRGRFRRLPLGYTDRVPYYMRLADFFIGKPGPGSISEALAMGLPVIVERNGRTLPQERYNTDWICENHVGLVVSSFRHIRPAVEQLLEPSNFARYRRNACALNNRAVFEIAAILFDLASLRAA
jgi:hypothetical protein